MAGFKIKCNLKSAKKQVDFIRSWKDRLPKIEQNLGWLAADYIRQHVEAKLPNNSQTKTYRQSIEVARIRGMGASGYAYAVQINTSAPNIRKVEPNRQLIYIQPARKTFRTNPEIVILQKYNPWTLDTLPFKPDNRSAIVTTKKVKAIDVIKVTRDRNKDRVQWRSELAKVGVKSPARSQAIIFTKSTAASLPNVALDGLKLEFGLGKQKANPAWRLAFRNLTRKGFKSFLKDKKNFILPLTKPSFSLWKKGTPSTKHSISKGDAKKFKEFQKKAYPQ